MRADSGKEHVPKASNFAQIIASAGLLVLILVTGCVSNSTAKAREKAAYIAGRQSAMEAQQSLQQVPMVRFSGPVVNSNVPWTPDLTLARALVEAGYQAPHEPSAIYVVRNGRAMQIDVKRLLAGEDMPLQNGDMVDIRP
jgi:hypothetical protein